MGQMSVEQTTAIIESTAKVVEATKEEPNYLWALLLVVVPSMLTYMLRRKKK